MRGAVVLLTIAGCGRIAFDARALDDGGAGDSPGPTDARLLGPWSAPTPVPLPSTGPDDDPTLAPGLLELYFDRSDDIFVATRIAIGAPWSTPTAVSQAAEPGVRDTAPDLTKDGLAMYFNSDRPGGLGLLDLWVLQRSQLGGTWSAAQHVPELSTSTAETGGSTSGDQLLLAFDADRGAADVDMWISSRASTASPWGSPAAILELDTGLDEEDPELSADGLTVYFAADYMGTKAIFVSQRLSRSMPFGPAQRIAELDSPAGDESDPWVSPDETTMYFTSTRSGMNTLYISTR